MSSTQLLMPSTDTYKEDTQSYNAIEKFDVSKSFHPNGKSPSHELGTPTSDSPLINRQLSNDSSETSSVHSSSQFEFEYLPTWTVPPDGGSATSPDNSDDEMHRVNHDVDLDVDEVPRKRQKTQTGSITGNARVTARFRVEPHDKISTIIDGGPRKRKLHAFTTPAVDSADTRVIHVAIPNTEASSTTTISSGTQIQKSSSSPTTVPRIQSSSAQNRSEKGDSASTHSRKRVNGLSGLLVSRPLVMSKSISDPLNSKVLEDRDEQPRETRGVALRPTNSSYGTKSKKPQGHIADQHELEAWTNADIAHIRFRKPDELEILDKVEEESTRRNVSHILKSLMEMETEGLDENGARNERTISNYVLSMPDSSIYTRCDDLVEEIFGPNNRNRGMKPKTGLVKAKQALETSRASSNTDSPIVTHSKVVITNSHNGEKIVNHSELSANPSLMSDVPTGVDHCPVSDVMDILGSQVSPFRSSVPENGHQSDFSEIQRKGISGSGEHQLFRRMQAIYPEDSTDWGKRIREKMVVGERRTDVTTLDKMADDVEQVDVEEDVPEKGEREVDEMGIEELKFLETPSKAQECTKTVKNIQVVDVATTSDIEREKIENMLMKRCPSIDDDEGQEDEEARDDVNSPQVPLPHLEDWSTTIRSLIKGKKKFEHQDLIDLKRTLQEIYNNRANISATCSLAQELYKVSRLEAHEVPNQDELCLRALARKSTRYWGIGKLGC